jgi:hypothetical protein
MDRGPKQDRFRAARGFRLSGWLWAFLLACASPAVALAANITVSASLEPQFVTLGETANLAISFQGTSQQAAPVLPEVPNLQIRYLGPSSQVTIVNGQVSSTVTHNYTVGAAAPGDYVIPPLTIEVGGRTLTTPALPLKVLKPEAPTPQSIQAGAQPAFLKMVVPKTNLYVGEVVAAELQLHVRSDVQGLDEFQMSSFPTDGLVTGKLVQGRQRQVRLGNFTFNVIPLAFTVRAVKTGSLTLGPPTATVVVQMPSRGRRDPLEFFNLGERKRVSLAADAQTLQGLPLPPGPAPAGFSGAVGNYTLSVSAGPTNVAVGDPITVRVQISGSGALETLALPDQTAWRDFKLYPPTSQLETTDALGLQGTRTFEQVVAPETADLKALPAFTFSFFDPERGRYQTLTHAAMPLVVRPAGAVPAPSVVARDPAAASDGGAREIVHIKPRPGTLAHVRPPLLSQPWFLVLQAVPLAIWVGAFLWRWRADRLAHNPRLIRARRLTQTLREGSAQLRRAAGQNQAEVFFSTLFRLLQELLGERLDLPASAITEAVIDEQLRRRAVAEPTLDSLHQLFQACNVARYAPVQTPQEMTALIASFEHVAGELRRIRL